MNCVPGSTSSRVQPFGRKNIQVYKERLCGALKDFVSWTSDPAGFRSVEGEKTEAVVVAARDTPGQAEAREELALNPATQPPRYFSGTNPRRPGCLPAEYSSGYDRNRGA